MLKRFKREIALISVYLFFLIWSFLDLLHKRVTISNYSTDLTNIVFYTTLFAIILTGVFLSIVLFSHNKKIVSFAPLLAVLAGFATLNIGLLPILAGVSMAREIRGKRVSDKIFYLFLGGIIVMVLMGYIKALTDSNVNISTSL